MTGLRVANYINQFFAGLGGEESANRPPERREGPVGPGRALAGLLKEDGRLVSTLVCGDSFFAESLEAGREAVRAWLQDVRPDLVVAGPAFAAGRYGVACADVCRIAAALGPADVTSRPTKNPRLPAFR